MEDWIGKHPAFYDGPAVNASDQIWTEFQACLKLKIDPDVEFSKPKESRMFIVGGCVADNMINSMRSYDAAKEREAKRK